MSGRYPHTFVPLQLRYSRSRARIQSRVLRWTLACISLVLCYQGVIRLCSLFDDTPRWANVFFPNVVVEGRNYTVQVRYHGSNPTQLAAKAKLINESGRTCAELKPRKPVADVRHQERTSFVFDIPPDPNTAAIQFSVSSLALPEFQRDPAQPLNPLIKSRRIKVITADSNDMLKIEHQSALNQILNEALSMGHWKAYRGDPTFVGWTLTCFYLVLGLLCLSCTGVNDRSRSRPLSTIYAWFWWLMTALVILIGMNKQLDLQIFLTDIGRAYSTAQGWYEQRKPVQIQMLAICATVVLGTVEWIGYKIRKAPKTTWTAGLGLVVLIFMFLLKGVSLKTMEHALSHRFLGLHLNELIEGLGIVCIGLSAVLYKLTNRHEVNYIIQ